MSASKFDRTKLRFNVSNLFFYDDPSILSGTTKKLFEEKIFERSHAPKPPSLDAQQGSSNNLQSSPKNNTSK